MITPYNDDNASLSHFPVASISLIYKNYLRELLKLFCQSFYRHLSQHLDALELLFVHRWVLLCFKREFPPAQSLLVWEACWSQWLTAHFHLFVCVAIIAVYGQDAVTQNMTLDEMLLHFSSLAMHMDARIVLRKVHFRSDGISIV